MPQLSQAGAIYASQLFWLAIVFGLIYFGIGRGMVPRIERTMENRDSRIAEDLAAAEAAHTTARLAEQNYQAELESARSQAMRAISEAKAKGTADAEAELRKGDIAISDQMAGAMIRIEEARDRALVEIEATTVEAVEQIVAKLSGVAADRAMIEKQVKVELAHG